MNNDDKLTNKIVDKLYEVDKNYLPSVHALAEEIVELVRDSEWISVKSKPESKYGNYWVFTKEGYISIAEWDGSDFCMVQNMSEYQNIEDYIFDVVVMYCEMAKPSPPKQPKE